MRPSLVIGIFIATAVAEFLAAFSDIYGSAKTLRPGF